MPEPWEILFVRALKQLEHGGVSKNDWTFGGGTVLKMKFNHRESKDIDIFLRDPQLLAFVSPRTNDAVEKDLKFYSELSHHTRLQFQEGEIDFICGPQISNIKPECTKILDKYVYVDHPVEIVAKKIHFRAEEFKPRDVFDLAIVFDAQKDKVLQNAIFFAEKLPVLLQRLNDLHSSGLLEPGLQSLALLPGSAKIRGREEELCHEFIKCMEKRLENTRATGRAHDAGFSR